MTNRRSMVIVGLLVLAALVAGMSRLTPVWMGRQPDGSFLVSTGQRIEAGSIAFTGRPIDLALHPREDVCRRPEQIRGLPGSPRRRPEGNERLA